MADAQQVKIQKVDEWRWRIPKEGRMRTEGLVYSDEKMMKDIRKDQSLLQVVNVATLPGIVGKSMAMPDIHWGYGFPIGGVAAFDVDKGIISPGGVGYDIN
jgi:tRNA-splicing ligase RtcB